VVDLVIVAIPTAVLWVVFAVVASIATNDPTATVGAVLVGLPAVLVVGYHVLLEWLFGTTVGKRLFGLVVVDRAGEDNFGSHGTGSEPPAAGEPAGWLSGRWAAGGCDRPPPTPRRPTRRDRRRRTRSVDR
jgi:RDD family.